MQYNKLAFDARFLGIWYICPCTTSVAMGKMVFILSDEFTYLISTSNYILNLRYRPWTPNLSTVLHTIKLLNCDNSNKFAY